MEAPAGGVEKLSTFRRGRETPRHQPTPWGNGSGRAMRASRTAADPGRRRCRLGRRTELRRSCSRRWGRSRRVDHQRAWLAGRPSAAHSPREPEFPAPCVALMADADLVIAIGTQFGPTDYDMFEDGGFVSPTERRDPHRRRSQKAGGKTSPGVGVHLRRREGRDGPSLPIDWLSEASSVGTGAAAG